MFGEVGGSREMTRGIMFWISFIGDWMAGGYKERELFCLRRKVEAGRSGEACRLGFEP